MKALSSSRVWGHQAILDQANAVQGETVAKLPSKNALVGGLTVDESCKCCLAQL